MKLKKIIPNLLFIGFLSIALVTPQTTIFAIDAEQVAGELANDSPVSSIEDIVDILTRIVGYMYVVFFVAAVGFILVAAFNFLAGGGDPKRITLAKQQLTYSAIAIVVALVSAGAATLIKNFLH